MTYAIRCENITKRYGTKFALQNLTLSLPTNQVIGVLGPNGAGKSTLFRMIMGLIRPEQGTIEVLNEKPGWQTNRNIAYLPDRARWYNDHTVARAFSWAEDLLPNFNRQQAEELALLMKLDLEMGANGMSKGQEARLMLILCLARDVPLIILDEPFSGIDLISREQIIEALIDHLSDRKQTLLISTHEIDEAESLFEHVVFLEQGGVILEGEVESLRGELGSMETIFRKLYR